MLGRKKRKNDGEKRERGGCSEGAWGGERFLTTDRSEGQNEVKRNRMRWDSSKVTDLAPSSLGPALQGVRESSSMIGSLCWSLLYSDNQP
jgi:hypothetical protein